MQPALRNVTESIDFLHCLPSFLPCLWEEAFFALLLLYIVNAELLQLRRDSSLLQKPLLTHMHFPCLSHHWSGSSWGSLGMFTLRQWRSTRHMSHGYPQWALAIRWELVLFWGDPACTISHVQQARGWGDSLLTCLECSSRPGTLALSDVSRGPSLLLVISIVKPNSLGDYEDGGNAGAFMWTCRNSLAWSAKAWLEYLLIIAPNKALIQRCLVF